MAQSGFTPILNYASGTPGNTPSAGNLTSSAAGAELALNYADGKLFYKDSGGSVQTLASKATGSIGGSTTQVQYNNSGALAGSANLTFDGTTLTANSATVSTGNLTFSGTAQRITGDMSNLTFGNRLAFQSSTTNGNTSVFALPNGTGVNSSFQSFNNSDPTNAAVGVFGIVGSTDVRIQSGITGTGTYLPMTFYTGGSERVRVDTSGNVAVGTTNAGTAGLSLSQNYNLSWEQSATESVPNLFRQASSAALVMSVGYKRSATANGFASSFGSSLAKTAISLGTTAGAITFYTDTAATTAVGTDVTPTERMRITASGNVGIGTGAPIGPFQVAGAGYFGSNSSQTTGTCAIYNDGNNVTIEAFAGNNSATKRDLLLATYGGNVGIGTASPGYKLDVNGTANFASTLNIANTAWLTFGGANTVFSSSAGGGLILQSPSTSENILFRNSSGTERMRIDSSGNVGIGTASPGAKLQINSQDGFLFDVGAGAKSFMRFGSAVTGEGTAELSYTRSTGAIAISAGDTGGSFTDLITISGSTGNVGIGSTGASGTRLWTAASSTATANYYDGARVVFQNTSATNGNFVDLSFASANGNDYAAIWGVCSSHTAGAATGALVFGTADASAAATERMRIDSSGNVGIGTSPNVRLEIASAPGEVLRLGNTTGGERLHFYTRNAVGTSRIETQNSDLQLFAFDSSPVVFGTNNTERMRITATGNIVAGASAALATTATDGFLYVPTCAGTPTGTPTAITGMAPIVVDTTNNKLYFYSSGTWRDAGP